MKSFASHLAKQAGLYLLQHFRKDPSLLQKRGLAKEVSTVYDKESDALITQAIVKEYPTHNLLTEESGFIDKKSQFTWIVDSLDGTSNFSVGNPFFAVSLAVLHKTDLVLGVVYAPFLHELYVAEQGKGAQCNSHPLSVSHIAEMQQSYAVACEGGAKSNERLAQMHAHIHPQLKDMRKLGSAALEGAFVASGRAEFYVTFAIPFYDVAAAILLVQEAGGKVTDFTGKHWKPETSDILMSNGLVHNQVLQHLKPA